MYFIFIVYSTVSYWDFLKFDLVTFKELIDLNIFVFIKIIIPN